MLRGMYTATGAMTALQRQQEILSNNLGNVRTPGFKANTGVVRSFPEMLIAEVSNPERGVSRQTGIVGPLSTGVYLQETRPVFSGGSINETGNPTDLYLRPNTGAPGQAMFQVEVEGEVLYSTNGRFVLDETGFLRTADGGYVLSNVGERIEVPSSEFVVDGAGNITVAGEGVATIGAYQVSDLGTLEEANGHYRVRGEEPPAADVTVEQGFIEESNVNLEQTMANLMINYRQFEANQRVVQAYDRSAERALEIARIR